MTKCCTRGVDYTTKNVEYLRCNLVGETQKLHSPCGFYQTKNILLGGSPVTLPLVLTVENGKPASLTTLNEFLQCWRLLGLAVGQQMGFPSKGQGEQHRHPWVVQGAIKQASAAFAGSFVLPAGLFWHTETAAIIFPGQHGKGDSTWKENKMRKISFRFQLLN